MPGSWPGARSTMSRGSPGATPSASVRAAAAYMLVASDIGGGAWPLTLEVLGAASAAPDIPENAPGHPDEEQVQNGQEAKLQREGGGLEHAGRYSSSKVR